MNNSQKLSNFYTNKEILLENSLEQFVENVLYFPQIGVELEFYLLNQNSQCPELVADYIFSLSQILSEDPKIYKIEKEQGASQIEIKIAPHSDLIALAKKIEKAKEVAKNLAQKNGNIACFEAQPFLDDCGSALQFNFSLHDIDGSNLFAKKNEQQNAGNFVEQNIFSRKFMLNSIAGMLNSIEWAMVFYAPQAQDYVRFNKEINRALHKKGKFTAPVNISFGDDNRTAAIRVPRIENSLHNFSSEKLKEGDYRIEFRVPSANADPFLAMTSLLIAIAHSISNQDLPQDSQKVFGNAFEEKYSLKEFARNLQIAEENFFNSSNNF